MDTRARASLPDFALALIHPSGAEERAKRGTSHRGNLDFMIQRVAASELREWIKKSPQTIAIVDVRDADFYGGQITGSTNYPSHNFSMKLPDLVEQVQGKEKVIFHCSLSQQRGPKASRAFESAVAGLPSKPDIFILQDGFVAWEKLYGKDPNLTINYDADHWKHGFQG